MKDPCSLPAAVALVYLAGHLLLVLSARRPLPSWKVLAAVDLVLGFVLAGILLGVRDFRSDAVWGARFVRLWAPIVFFWWAYTWAGKVLHVLHAPDFSIDATLLGLEKRLFGQPSLWMALGRCPWLTEVMHFFYATYYLYTPLLGIYLHVQQRFEDFEAVSSAVLIGYASSYLLFSLVPVWGPRWGLVEAKLLDRSLQVLQGGLLTRWMNGIMYGGVAHKGGAMPSSHSSTAVVFLIWCWRIWGAEGGVPALVVVVGMWVGSVYGRYHYVLDILAGALLGLCGVAAADWYYGR